MKLELLEAFEPFSDLDEKSKLIVANCLSTFTLNRDAVLFEVGDTGQDEFFLVEGEIELIAIDGIKKKIHSGDPVSRFPLALLRPRKFSAKVLSNSASLIKIDKAHQ